MSFVLLVLAAVGMRFLPHVPNFTPIGAMLLFCGAWMGAKRLWIPMAAIIGSDFLLNGLVLHAAPNADQYFQWAGWLVYLGLGYLLLRHSLKPLRIGGTTVLGAAAFFLISNFGVWAAGVLYPRTAQGLAECYVAGLPFAYRMAAGDLIYAAAIFGVYAWARQRAARRAAATA